MANPAYSSLAHMFHENVKRHGPLTLYKSKRDGVYRGLTYAQVGAIVNNLALGLASLGIRKDDKVAIISPTREEWAMSDFAILSLGAVTVPIYPTLPAKQAEYILSNSDAKVIFTSDTEQLDKILGVRDRCPQLKHIVTFQKESRTGDGIMDFNALQETGKQYGASHLGLIEASLAKIQLSDLATIIYTSGTTGTPKGVMLTHNNILSNVLGASKVLPMQPGEVFLSFLPLSHIFERTAGHFLPIYFGSTVAYAESIETVAQNMGEVRPTLMTAVPRLYEKMYGRVKDGIAAAPKVRQKIFHWAVGVGEHARKTGEKGFKYALANKLVFSKLHARLGGRVKCMVSGGAPLSGEIAEFFANMGVMILEGYGLTETSPIITVNRPELIKFGTVGCPIEHVEVKIAADGEILARGPNIMKGYYKNDEATREMIDAEGWLHTGDIGFLDGDQYLTITDRKKNLIVTSGGKNVAPQPIENLLSTNPYIDQIMVIGDKRNFISALIVPNLEKLRALAKELQIAFHSDDELIKNPKLIAHLDAMIQKAQDDAGIARYEKVRKFALLPRAFTIETGELTPKLSIRRNVVIDNFNSIINALYSEHDKTRDDD